MFLVSVPKIFKIAMRVPCSETTTGWPENGTIKIPVYLPVYFLEIPVC